MQNLLIVEDNLIQSHFLANSICKNIPNIRLYNIVSTGIEAIEIIKREKVDIIILDLKLPDMNGIDIIKYIEQNNIVKYISSIIIITGEISLLSKIIGNKYVYSYCSKTNTTDSAINLIRDLADEKQKEYSKDSIKTRIKEELEKIRFDFSYLGTKYLFECINECYYKNDIYDINLNRDIYPIISKKYHKTINSIKVSIFQANYIMYYENDINALCDYFGYTIIDKPKTKEIISTILQKLKK